MVPQAKVLPHVPYRQALKNFLEGNAAYYRQPSIHYLEPFRIFGNLYYVGDKRVCCHLVDTGAGLILFDSGYPQATHMLIDSIWRLGFDPADIRYIIHSHGHFDHFGGSNEMKAIYGCELLMSAADTASLREDPRRALIGWGPKPNDAIAWPDRELRDGEILELGNTKIKCVLTPGHTVGVMTFFLDVTDGETVHRVGYMGGAGFFTIYREHCRDFGLPEDLCLRLGQSIQKVWDEPVDITLGNHPSQNCTLEKRQWMLEHPGENPFVDPNGWHAFLRTLEEKRREFETLGY